MSHAQSSTAEQALIQALGTVQPNTSNPNQANQQANSAKYEEHQSICRTNDYDVVAELSDDIKQKRIELIKNKISTEKNVSVQTKLQIRLIKEYMDQGLYKEAKPTIAELKKIKLDSNTNEFLNAHIAIIENNHNLARDTLSKIIKAEPENTDVLKLLGEIYTYQENYYEASTIYEDLNALTKDEYLIQLCESLVLNSLNADGEKACLRAANKFPKSPLPHIFIGISYREREDLDKALIAFTKANTIKSTEMGHTCKAEIFALKNKHDEAVKSFNESLDNNPFSERALIGMAWSELKLKRYSNSLQTFKKACSLNGKNQAELRRAFKVLSEEKIADAKRFIKLADECGG